MCQEAACVQISLDVILETGRCPSFTYLSGNLIFQKPIQLVPMRRLACIMFSNLLLSLDVLVEADDDEGGVCCRGVSGVHGYVSGFILGHLNLKPSKLVLMSVGYVAKDVMGCMAAVRGGGGAQRSLTKKFVIKTGDCGVCCRGGAGVYGPRGFGVRRRNCVCR